MFIALNGFETQIFMDIRQEKDKDGSLKELCDFLNGKGTPDLHTAWQELHYKKLYQAFQNVISAEVCESLGTLKMSAKELKAEKLKKATATSVKKLIEKPLEYFYEVANEFAEKEYLEEESRKREEEKAALRTWYDGEVARLKSDADKTQIDADVVSERESSAKTKKSASKNAKKPKADDTAKKEKALKAEYEKKLSAIEKNVAKFTKIAVSKSLAFPKGKKINNEEVYLYIYSALSPLAHGGLARKWSLQRKIAEFTGNTKIGSMESYNFFDRAFALAEGKEPSLTEKSAKEDALLVAKKLADSNEAWLLVGSNEYDGVRWFNKEKMESSLALYKAILELGASAAKKAAADSLFKKLNNAQKKAEYKCEEFVKVFEPKGKKK